MDTERLRYVLWRGHGHDSALYGDDGEMQCGLCMPDWDYLRSPLPQLIEHAYSALAIVEIEAHEQRPWRWGWKDTGLLWVMCTIVGLWTGFLAVIFERLAQALW